MRPRLDTRICIMVLAAYPLLLMLVNDSWVFGNTLSVTIDDHIYTGYFFNLPQYAKIFSLTYFGTRLPWILFGYAVHALVPPELAHYILRLALWYGAAFSLFAIIRLLFADNAAALVGALLMGTHMYFLRAIGWDYVNGAAIALILAGTALLTAATRSRHWRLALVAAGAAQAAMVSDQLVLAMLVPVQLAWYHAIDRRCSRHPVPASLAFLACGALVMLATLGGVNSALGGHFFFLAPQLKAGMAIANNPGEWKPPDYSWVRHATWLVFPGVACGAALVFGAAVILSWFRRGRASPGDVSALLAILQLVIVAGLFVLSEAAGFWLLYYVPYASYLLPFVYIAIAAILARGFAGVPSQRAWAIAIGVALCLLASFIPWVARTLAEHAPGSDLVGAAGAVAVAAAILLASAGLTRSAPVIVSAIVALAVLNISVADANVFSFPPDLRRRAATLTVYDAIHAIQHYDHDGALQFWYNWRDPLGGIFTAVSSAYLWYWTLITNEFPELIMKGVRRNVHPGERLVILSARDDARGLAQKALAPLGLRLVTLGYERVQRGPIAFGLTFAKLEPAAEGTAVNIPPSGMIPEGTATLTAQHSSGVTMLTNVEPFSWAGRLPLPVEQVRRYPGAHAVVRVRLSVSHGCITVGIVNKDGTDFIARQMVPAGAGDVELGLGIPRLGDAGPLVITNWDVRGRSLARVESVSLATYAVPGSR